ncbi:MAG TPA: hypothetical protein PKX14_12510 [Thauera aminoaromatica]|nr:hypothetical protein [Thauera aminoaromatica]
MRVRQAGRQVAVRVARARHLEAIRRGAACTGAARAASRHGCGGELAALEQEGRRGVAIGTGVAASRGRQIGFRQQCGILKRLAPAVRNQLQRARFGAGRIRAGGGFGATGEQCGNRCRQAGKGCRVGGRACRRGDRIGRCCVGVDRGARGQGGEARGVARLARDGLRRSGGSGIAIA